MSGSFCFIVSAPRWVKSKYTKSLLGPAPFPSLISVAIALDTMSLGAKSLIDGAYLSINLSPSLFLKIPPSPLAASESKIPSL